MAVIVEKFPRRMFGEKFIISTMSNCPGKYSPVKSCSWFGEGGLLITVPYGEEVQSLTPEYTNFYGNDTPYLE